MTVTESQTCKNLIKYAELIATELYGISIDLTIYERMKLALKIIELSYKLNGNSDEYITK